MDCQAINKAFPSGSGQLHCRQAALKIAGNIIWALIGFMDIHDQSDAVLDHLTSAPTLISQK